MEKSFSQSYSFSRGKALNLHKVDENCQREASVVKDKQCAAKNTSDRLN